MGIPHIQIHSMNFPPFIARILRDTCVACVHLARYTFPRLCSSILSHYQSVLALFKEIYGLSWSGLYDYADRAIHVISRSPDTAGEWIR